VFVFVFVFESGGDETLHERQGIWQEFLLRCEISDLIYFGLLPCGWR